MSAEFNQADGFYSGEYDGQYDQSQQQQQQYGQYPPQQQYSYDQSHTGYDQSQSGYDYSQTAPQAQQFGDQQWAQTDYSQDTSYAAPQPDNSTFFSGSGGYSGSILTPGEAPGGDAKAAGGGAAGFEDEPPLLEELGINFDHISRKTMTVLNPLKVAEHDIMEDSDMAGPFVFILAFGGSLLLAGKVQFGYIYGIGVLGCLAMYALLNLMSLSGVTAGCVISVLGYCLLPMVMLSFFAVAVSLQGIVGTVLTTVTVVWCAYSAAKLFVSALSMTDQQLIIAYPCALVYGVFALLAVF